MEKVAAVHTEVPHYLPKFENPIFVAAQAQKKALRDEALIRIKSGNYENGFAPLFKLVVPITKEELEDIMNAWHSQGLSQYISCYSHALATNSVESAITTDIAIAGIQNQEKSVAR